MAGQSVVYIRDANGAIQPIGCQQVSTYGGVSGVYLQTSTLLPWNATLVTASGFTVIKGSPGVFGALINMSNTGSQQGNAAVYDNATTGTGNYYVNTDNLQTEVGFLPNGVAMVNGIVLNLAQAAIGEGYLVLWQ